MATTTKPVSDVLTLPPLSQSRYELMACPAFYIERIIRAKKEPQNPWALRGTQIHAVLAGYLNHLVQTRQPSDYELFDELVRVIDGEAREILDAMRDALIIDPERVLGTEVYLCLTEKLDPIDPETPEGAGIDESFTPAFEGTLDFTLAPDRTTIEVWDWKSYYQIIEPDTFQAKLYPLLVFQHYPGAEVVRFHLQFVRYGVSRSIEYTRAEDLPKLKKAALAARARQQQLHMDHYSDGKVEPMPGQHCCYCPLLKDGCPIEKINPYADQSPVDRVKFALWLAASKKQNDQVLKDFVNVQGPIVYSDGNGNSCEAGFHLQKRSGYPAIAALPIVEAADPQLATKLTLSGLSTALKAKKRAPLAEKLAPLNQPTHITKFGVTGIDEEE